MNTNVNLAESRKIEYAIFEELIAFDCRNENKKGQFDAKSIQWFRPTEMTKVLQRLWQHNATVHGMDIAEDVGEGNGVRGSRWEIVGADWPDSDDLDCWIAFVTHKNMKNCAFSVSYSFPEGLALRIAARK